MNQEEFEQANNWSNEQYFEYMKETGNWLAGENLGHTGKPCSRCEYDGHSIWKVEALIEVENDTSGGYTAGTEFEVCLLCMMELYASTYPNK